LGGELKGEVSCSRPRAAVPCHLGGLWAKQVRDLARESMESWLALGALVGVEHWGSFANTRAGAVKVLDFR